MAPEPSRAGYRPFCVADRPNHLRILADAAARTDGFGVLVRATVTETVQELVAEMDVPVVVDCGAFAEGGAITNFPTLYDRFEAMDADYGLVPDVLNERIENDHNAADAMRYYRRHGRYTFDLIGAAQGTCVPEYRDSVWDLYHLGYDHIALGGLLETEGDRSGGHATATDEMVEIVRAVRERNPDKWLFVLGGHHPDRQPVWEDQDVYGADSKRWLFQYDADATASRHEQLVGAVERLANTSHPSLSRFARSEADG
jgi:hypothetical protein